MGYSAARLRLIALLLSLCLWCTLLTAGASAAFTDVQAGTWFYEDISVLQTAGIVHGYPDGSFRPGNPVSCAEAMKMILMAAGHPIAGDGEQVWFAPYFAYAVAHGITDTDTVPDPGTAITRDWTAELIVRAMGLTPDAAESPFADSGNLYAVTLYRAGIIRGEVIDGQTYYRGARTLNRAELAAIVVRMMQVEALRPAPERLLPPDCAMPETPTTVEDFVQMLICMAVSGADEQTFVYHGTDMETVKARYLPLLNEAYPIAIDLCRETVVYYHAYSLNLAYDGRDVTVTLKLSGGDYSAVDCRQMLDFSLMHARAVVEEIRTACRAAGETTERQFARRCLEWVATHCQYAERDDMLDQYAYAVFRDGSAVCSGYTAAYNLLLKLGGVKCMSMTGVAESSVGSGPHAWTIAELDGETVWIDATWCDPVGLPEDGVVYTYFALDEATFAENHTPAWDYTAYWAMLG